MNQENKKYLQKTKRNTLHLAYWTSAWVLTLAVVAFGPKFIWNSQNAISIIAIVINTLIGIGMIIANKKLLDGMDEMLRKIHLDSMAIALGVAIIGGLSYSMLDIQNIIPFDAEISHLVVLISITYMVSIIIGNARYK